MQNILGMIQCLILQNIMLNKLRFFRGKSSHFDLEGQRQAAGRYFRGYFASQDISLENIEGGTLGITFLCKGLRDDPVFIKTHLPAKTCRTALNKEYYMLKAGYENDLFLERLCIPSGNDSSNVFVLMDYLKPESHISRTDILKLIASYRYLKPDPLEFDGAGIYDINELLNEARNSLYDLDKQGFYSAKIYKTAEALLENLELYLTDAPRSLCHGDLADKNIMINQSDKKIILDWEDAFWGIEGYDYLYWLTFFNHRKLYNDREVFTVPGKPSEVIAGILTLILLIKNAISFYSGEYAHNKLDMNDRIEEIYIGMGIKI